MNMIRTTHTIGGVDVVPGAVLRPRSVSTSFDVRARCESLDPERFTAAICLDGQPLWRSPAFSNYEQAERAAEDHFAERLRQLFV